MTKYLLLITFIFTSFAPVYAQDVPESFRVTGYPLPRFVSVRAGEAFVRAGPGTKYPVKWIVQKEGLPVEVILEFDNWRKIRDYEGEEGWIHQSLLSGRRGAIVEAKEAVPLYRKPGVDEDKRALIEPMTLARLQSCEEGWCAIEAEGYEGWIERKYVWGIYEKEIFD